MRPLVRPTAALDAKPPGPSDSAQKKHQPVHPRPRKIKRQPPKGDQDGPQSHICANCTPLIPRHENKDAERSHDDGHYLPTVPVEGAATANEQYLVAQLQQLAKLQFQHRVCFKECIPGRCITEDPHVRWFLQQPLFQDPNIAGPSERPPSFDALQFNASANRAASCGVAAVEPRPARPTTKKMKHVLRIIEPVAMVDDYIVSVPAPAAPVLNVCGSAFNAGESHSGADETLFTPHEPTFDTKEPHLNHIQQSFIVNKPSPRVNDLYMQALAPSIRNLPVSTPATPAQHVGNRRPVVGPMVYGRFAHAMRNALHRQTPAPPAPLLHVPTTKTLPQKRARGNVLILGPRVDHSAMRVPPRPTDVAAPPLPPAAPSPRTLIPIVQPTHLHIIPKDDMPTHKGLQHAPVGLSPVPVQQPAPSDFEENTIPNMDLLAARYPTQADDVARTSTHLEQAIQASKGPSGGTAGSRGRKSRLTTVFSSDGDDEASEVEVLVRRKGSVMV